MAFTPYHNISGADGLLQELIKPGDFTGNIKSILMCNTDTTDIQVSLFLEDDPPAGTATSTFYIMRGVVIPPYASLLIDNEALLSYNGNKYGLYVQLLDTGYILDILINT